MSNRPRRNAGHRAEVRQVARDDRACSDDDSFSDRDAWTDNCGGTDQCARAYLDVPAEMGTRANVDEVAEGAVVIHGCGCINYYVATYSGIGLNDSPCEHNSAGAELY